MTPEIIEQYYLWDEVAKKEVERYPWLIMPLIQEVFHKVYPENVEIRLIATEYVVRRIHKDGGSTLNSIFADIAVQIENRDIYHMECQMNKEKGMMLRILEYDIHIGLVHGTVTENAGKAASIENRHELIMPKSVILYLNDTGSMPVEETCLIRFADGTTHEYRVPVINVQSYTTEMTELLDITCGYLLKNEPELKKEVRGIMRPIIMTQTEKIERAEYEIKLISEEMQRIRQGMQKAEKESKMHSERNENAIRKSIEKYCSSALNRQEVKESIQDIFSLDGAEAEEKMEKYWIQVESSR